MNRNVTIVVNVILIFTKMSLILSGVLNLSGRVMILPFLGRWHNITLDD